jgi:mannose-1-phosphate guanylyltransferase
VTAAMLLAAGRGTRLKPLTDRFPKALVPIGDRPVIAHVIDNLRSKLANVKLVVNAHHEAELLVEFLAGYDANIEVLVEADLLGTAGGVRAAQPHLETGPVIVANADILTNPNYLDLLSECDSSSCSLCVSCRPPGLGSIGVDSQGNVVRMRGEVFGEEVTGADYVGVAALGAAAIESLPEFGCLIGDWALPRLRRAESIKAHVDSASWTDIGEIRAYASANWAWLSARNLRSWTASDARVRRGANLVDTIVGSGASIETTGPLSKVIVWPGALVTEPMNDCIVMAGGRVVPIRA